ncbi:MAG: hypothetical protein ACK5KT_08485 [Dysgonomonas sp.]
MLEKFDKNKNPFKVPENYFESFNADIMSKLPEKKMKQVKVVPLWRKIVPWTAVAAVFFGILFTTGVFRQSAVTTSSTLAGQDDAVILNGIASASSIEDDYFLFIEDEVSSAKYKEIMYSN